MIDVRRGTVDDIPGLVASSTGLFAEDAGTRDDTMNIQWPAQFGAASYATTLADPARAVVVADDSGSIVGHLTAYLTEALTGGKPPVDMITPADRPILRRRRNGSVASRCARVGAARSPLHGRNRGHSPFDRRWC